MARTPMMQQYEDAKAACPDALLLFRMGDFYELFHEDAKTSAKVLGLTLTSRDKGEDPIPMAGFPHHQLESYLGKLIRAGYRVAVCDQVEDPRTAKGLVKREVTRLVTPGTITDDGLLDPRESNYLAAIAHAAGKSNDSNEQIGLAWADLSTGRFMATGFPAEQLNDQLGRIAPSECLISEDEATAFETSIEVMITRRPPWVFGISDATRRLHEHFGVQTLEGFGFEPEDAAAVRAAGALIEYLGETQRAALPHINRLIRYQSKQTLEIDVATRRSLEITRTLRDGSRHGSLLWVLDRCVTSMGSRMLSDWVNAPLTDPATIDRRLDAVDEWTQRGADRQTFRELLGGVYDLQRLLARVITGRATPRDLAFVGFTLGKLPAMIELVSAAQAEFTCELAEQVDACPELHQSLSRMLVDDCPLSARDGGMIRAGVNAQLDELRELARGGKQWIAEYQGRMTTEMGIPNLKVGYNKVFGYYLEVTHAHRDKVPDNFIRKQTLKNAERYITPELKEYEEKVVSADDQSRDLEFELFQQLRADVQASAHRLQRTATALAQLDVLAALAELAIDRSYCRPVITDDPETRIIEGRHPVLDVTEPAGTFVPNDTMASADEGMILLITGPNMAGKSTYIRQVALLTLMGQIGSFVPAREATIGVADRLFARVGASDELSKGQSTFMVEMIETARILNTATSRSLVILDEIGRGTSTYDGLSLAWSIVEHLHDHVGCRTLFATHYHELTDLESALIGVRNYNVSVKEWDDNVVFLHKIVAGAADKSYGIHVARLAGVPAEVNERAKQILTHLEAEHLGQREKTTTPTLTQTRAPGDIQLTLFAADEHPVVDKLRQLDLDHLTPIQALQLLQELQQSALGK